METRFALLARHAEVTPDGSLSFLGGGLEFITAPAFPFVFPILSAVYGLWATQEECNRELRVRFEIAGPGEGQSLMNNDFPITVPLNPANPRHAGSVVLAVNLIALQFPEAGRYEFRLWEGDHLVGMAPLDLVPQP